MKDVTTPLVTMDVTTNTDTITRDMGCDPRPNIRVMYSSMNTEQIVMRDSTCDALPPSTTDTGTDPINWGLEMTRQYLQE
jgi:hypothetical protein